MLSHTKKAGTQQRTDLARHECARCRDTPANKRTLSAVRTQFASFVTLCRTAADTYVTGLSSRALAPQTASKATPAQFSILSGRQLCARNMNDYKYNDWETGPTDDDTFMPVYDDEEVVQSCVRATQDQFIVLIAPFFVWNVVYRLAIFISNVVFRTKSQTGKCRFVCLLPGFNVSARPTRAHRPAHRAMTIVLRSVFSDIPRYLQHIVSILCGLALSYQLLELLALSQREVKFCLMLAGIAYVQLAILSKVTRHRLGALMVFVYIATIFGW